MRPPQRPYVLAFAALCLGVMIGMFMHPAEFDRVTDDLTKQIEAQRKLIELYEAERQEMKDLLTGKRDTAPRVD